MSSEMMPTSLSVACFKHSYPTKGTIKISQRLHWTTGPKWNLQTKHKAENELAINIPYISMDYNKIVQKMILK